MSKSKVSNAVYNSRIEQWADALLDGDFKQITGKMRGPGNKRCVLGVACEVFAAANLDREFNLLLGSKYELDGETNEHGEALPDEVRAWFGLNYDDPILVIGGEPFTLVDLNDEKHASFTLLAALIREHLKRKTVKKAKTAVKVTLPTYKPALTGPLPGSPQERAWVTRRANAKAALSKKLSPQERAWVTRRAIYGSSGRMIG